MTLQPQDRPYLRETKLSNAVYSARKGRKNMKGVVSSKTIPFIWSQHVECGDVTIEGTKVPQSVRTRWVALVRAGRFGRGWRIRRECTLDGGDVVSGESQALKERQVKR